MRKPTILKSVFVVLFFIQSFIVFSQKNFTARFDTSLKGDMLLIGNNILNRDENKNNQRPNNAFDAIDKNNNDLNMQYVDVDSDNSTFSSSSATLAVPTASRECYKIVYAGLYWAGIYSKGSVDDNSVNRANLGKVKFKLANQTNYNDITGTLIYDYYPATSNGDQMPYAYYYDATSLIQGLANPEGAYTVANIISARGKINGGFSAGWSLFVVYEDPKSSAKYITTFDGLRWIQSGSVPVTYDITGFKTIPTGAVKAKLAFAALEGDVNLTGDRYSVNNTDISTNERPIDNFFNSTINDVNGPYTNRNPASGNTLGFEAGIINLNNAGNSIIKNNDTSAQLKLSTGGDGYGLFFNAFNVEVIEPQIVLTKIVKNSAGVNIGGQDVTLGQQLNYEIGFKNIGNDNATSFTIRDQLPINIIFNYPGDIVALPTGVTIQSYDAATRNIVFAVNSNIVKVGDPEKIISFKVQVVPDCSKLSEACSNSIDNSAYATYKGQQNTSFTISDDPSVNINTGCILVPKATNFLVGIDGCKFTANVTLCKENVDLVAANGYSAYTWYSDEARTKQIGTGQTLNVKDPGTYYVYNLAAAPCRSIYQAFTVTRFGTTTTNPVIPYADNVVTCPDNGKALPNIFLCGGNATRLIQTHISENSTIVWEKLNTTSCTAITNQNCANEGTSCTWSQVGTGADYTANAPGQYRLTVNYTGGCFNRFYFNVYQNTLTATETHEDIICGAPGKITVNGVPSGYEYAISTDPNGTIGAYQASNVFNITNPNSYTVYIRQIGVTSNPCVFTVPNILIRKRDLQISTVVTQPACFGEKGTIKVGTLNIDPQYYYYLYDGNTLVNSSGPVPNSDYTFANLTPGISYRVRVTNRPVPGTPAPNCDVSEYIYIQQPVSAINATAALVEPLTACSDGKIVISASGGNWAPYSYFINGSSTFQTSNEIIVTAPGTYSIRVVDSKNCETTISVTVPSNTKPTYDVTHTDSNCYNDNSEIRFTNIVPNGYSMSYSIDNGGTFQTNPVFSNLQPGTYNVVVKYGISYIPQWQTQPQIKYCQDPAQQVTIAGPSSAVTASAGVAELAGCGPLQGGQPTGLIRFTNVEGGTAPYQYSFDGGATWQTSNEKYVVSSTVSYDLRVKDNAGCIYKIPYNVILDPKPQDPVIDSNVNPVFNCDGTATATVVVNTPTTTGATYSYEYYLDGVLNTNTPGNTFLNVPSGSHTVKIKYNVATVSTYSNLLQEDFGRGGDTTSPGINSAYCWEKQDGNTLAFATCSLSDWHPWLMNDGDYVVTSALLPDHGPDFNWILPKDHTAVLNNTPTITDGRFLAVNIGKAIPIGAVLYKKPINDVIPNQDIKVSLYMLNLLKKTNNLPSPQLTIQLVKGTTVIASQIMPSIPRDEQWHSSTDLAGVLLTLNPGNNTSLDFQIISNSQVVSGNDLAVDDILVYQIPKSCIAQKDVPIVIDSNKAFSGSITGFKDLTCSGSNNGEITIAAQNFNLPYGFDYSLDDGATWINSKVSPVTATGLTNKTYLVRIRFDAGGSSCVFPFTQVIKSPSALTVTAQVTAQPTCANGASITATANGGTPNYQYELRQSNGTTVVVAFQNSNIFTNVATGSYTIVVRDANSCASPASARVDINAPTAPTASLSASSDICYDTINQSTLIVTATGAGTLSYSLDSQPAQNSNTFTNVGPGTHNIVVTDSNNCIATVSNIVIAPELKGSATVSKTLDCTGSPDATISVTISGGTSAFTYKVKKGAGVYGSSINVTGTSFVYTANSADTYTFEITDSKGCINIVSAIVNPIVNPTVAATKVDATCNGASTGSVQLIGSGGSGGYTYLFYNNTTTPVPTTFVGQSNYTGLAAGTYSYQVMDSKGCKSAVGSITITQPTNLTATATATTFTCDSSNVKQAATVTIAVPTTGTAPYQYSFDGGTAFTGTRTLSVTDNGTNQVISYVVSDAQGCKTPVQTITINRLNPPTNLTFSAANVTCTATTTTVTATATNGVGTLTYSITAPAASVASNTTGVFSGLIAGTYNFRVTDANGCYFEKPFTINAVTPIAVVGNKTTDVLCKGGSTGSGAYTVSGNAVVGGYTFTLTAGTLGTGTLTKSGNTLTLSNVAAGTYTVQVTDSATGCTNTASIVITEPAVGLTIASATATNVSCNDDNSLITVTANGGTPNYTYAYAKNPSVAPTSTYASSNVLTVDTNSGADVAWDVYVKDTNGCTSKSTVNVLLDAMPAVTNVTVNNQCTASGSGFTITVTATGLAPLTYGINGPTGAFQPSNTFTVAAGTYTVYVKDKNGCIVSAPAATIVYPQLTAVGTVTKELDCSATPNATITVTIGGGKGPFTYTVKKGAGAPGAASASIAGPTFTYSVTPANADTYTFAVTDANGCTKSAIVVVDPISNPTVTAAQTNAGCNGLSDGSVTLTGTGGSGGFTYSNNATTGFTANPTFTGLAAGSYTFYVKDSKGCSGSVAVVITQPTTLAATVSTVPFTCNTTSNAKVAGTVTVNVTAGTGTAPYEYSFNGSGYSANNVLTLNDNGADQPYTYSVRDAKGCPVAGSGTLLRLNPPTDLTFVSPSVTCTATTTTVTLTAVNGVGTLQYETIAPSPVIIGKQSSNAFANLAPGTYMFRVTDANGCYYTESYTVNPVTPIAVVGNKTTDVLCKGGSTGSGAYTVSGNAVVGGYTFTLTAGTLGTGTLTKSGNTLTLSNVAAGTYTVQVTDSATGCTNTASIVITEPAVALSATYAAVNANCLTSTSEVTVTATGGTPVYKYSFVQDGAAVGVYSNNNKANLDPTVNVNWDVYVTDANGCTFKLDLVIAKDLVPTVTASVLNQCSASGNTFQIRAVGASGVGPYTYTINTGVAPSPADTFTVAAGTYTITVKDANGCTNTTIVTVNQALTASAIVTKDITCANPQEATINVSILGGKTPFGYRVNINGGGFSGSPIAFGGSSFTYTATALTGATYQFEITDANGTPCTALTNSVNTNTAGSVTASYAKVDPTCNGFTDGSIKLTATAGVSPFVYSIDNGVTFSSSNVFGGLTAGTYNYIVKDSKGCESVPAIITLTNPAPIVVNIVRNAIQCNTNTPGSFDVNVISGGTAPYVYKLYDNAFTEIATYTEASSLPTPVYSFGGLNFGDYYITVVDAKGCEYNSGKLRIETPPYLAMTGVADSNNCATGVDVTVTTSGGTGPYRYSIFGQPLTETAPLASNVYTFVGLSHGITYFLQVKDSYNCISILEFKTPDPPSTIKITGTATTNVTCNGTSNGTLDFTVQDYDLSVTNIQYEVLNALTLLPLTTPINGVLTGAAGGPVNGNITTLPAGNYVLKVTEVGGTECSTAFTFTITQPGQPLVSTVTSVVNANCNSGALVTLTTTGGTGPYTYAAAAGSVPTTFIAGNVLNLDYNLGNNWNIIVKDANGCTFPLTQSIIKDPSPVIALSIVDKCVAEGTFGINVTETTAGTGAYSISVDNSTYASILGLPYNISGLNSGSHTIAVKDANGCIDTKSIIIAEPLQLVPAINALPTCANNDGQITLTGTGGTGAGTYSYSISPVAGSIAGNVISGLPAGTYTVTMTDTAIPTNCSTTASVTLIAPTPVTFTTVTTDVTCNGDTDGIITVNLGAGNDNPNYTYEITAGPAIRPAQSSNLFTGLAAGTYTVKVNSGRGCDSDDTNVVVGSPLVLKASSDLTTALTCTAGNVATKALVTITATDGTAPYLYSFDGGVTYTSTNTYEAFVGTTFDVFVKDAKGCLLTLTNGVNIPGLNPPTNMDISGTPIWCAPAANTTSTVTISNVINGVGALQYEILSPIVVAKQSGAAFAGLTPDTYLFQVTDANGCTYQESYTINPVTNITISGQLVNDVTCNGKTDGAVKFTVANYAGAYTAVLTAGTGTLTQTGNTVDVTGLVPGTYTVEVKDNITGCIASTSVVVSEPTVLDIAIDSNINANCNFGAKVAVIATGGTPNYTYAFVQDGATPLAGDYTNTANAVLDPLVNTQWDVYVKDARGCTDIVDVTIGTDALPTINPSAGLYCYTGGPVPITITGTYVGTPTYSIGNGYQSSPNFVLNAPGNYTFYIKDGNGCIVSSPYTLNQELLLQASLTQDLTCAGSATITLLATQGTTTYAGFEVDINGGGYNAATSPYTAVAAGTYTFRVTDSQGCQSVSIPVTVTPNTTPTATFTKTNVSCIGGNDGSIIVTAADGILPYQYSINSGAFQPSNIFTGLTAGTYDIVVKDAKECTSVIVQATITEPTALAALASLTQGLSCGTGNSTQPAIVTVDVTPGTGTAPYQYSFNGGTNYSSTNTFTTSTAGLVTAYVKDANNCIIAVPVSVNIPAIDPPTIDNIIGTPIWCAPAANTASTVTVTVSHGVGTLNYEILSPASAVTNTSGASNGVFTMLAADTYLFQVTDANGCKDEAYYTVDPLINITTTGQLVNDVSCNGGSDGSVKFDVDNFTGTYTAALIGGPVTGTLTQTGKVVTLTNLPVGTYIIQVKDEITGCIATASVVVSQPSLLTLTQTANVNANCNSGAQVSVSAAGGTPDYKYAFVVDTATPTATDYTNSNNAVLNPGTSLNWKAYVVDSKGCETFIPITITLDPVPSAITAIVANQCPSATGDYTFTVNVGSGVAPYEYNIGKGFQLSPTFTVTSGTYDVTVKDANGCETTVNAAVTIAPALQLDATLTALPSCTINNGIITATATGGSGAANYNYTLDGGVIVTTTPAVFNNVAPGTHIVRVRDIVTTCTYDVTVEIAPATIITGLTLDGSDVSCKGSSDGSITAVLAPNGAGVNDNLVYTYTLTGTTVLGVAVNRPAQTLNIFENLEAGDYTVTVTSGRGCVDSEDIRIKEPAVIVVNAPVIVQYGCASGTNTSNYATITVNSVTGGSGNYIIYEFLKNGVVVQKGAENVYNESDFLGGNYLVNVYDDNGCMGSTVGTVTVNPYINLDAVNVAVSNAITCISNEDITVTVTTTGGTPVLLNYTVTGTNGNTYNQTNTNGNFTGLTIGDYLITVSNPATGCSIEKIHYVNDPNTFEIKVTPVNGKICFGTTDGSVDLTFVDNQLVPTNDAGAFDYTITGPLTINGTTTNAGPFNIPNLVAGQYTVVAKLVNKPECTVTTVFNIEQPSAVLTVTTTQSEITCVTGNNDGVISASAAGGWNTTNYQYQLVLGGNVLVDYSNQAVFNGLSAGVYTINAKDSNDCIATTTATLVVPDPIVITTSPDVLLTCFGAKNGTITVTNVTGGQGSNYLYTLNIVSATPVIVSGPQTSPVFTGLGTGTYSITVTDGYNCTATSGTIVISEPTEVIPSLVVSKTQTCLTQTTLTLSAVGGTSPYTYSADANFATVIGSFASSTSFDVPAGNYHYYVKDANDCVSFISNDIKIEPIEPLIVNLELSNAVVKCTGSATGVIVANSTGGLGGYQYTLLNGAGTTILAGPQAEDRFENLIAGTYTVKVDSGDCSDTESVIIKQPDTPFTAFATPTPVMCFGDKSGKIVVTASGGTGAYVYSISPRSDQYFDDGIFENLAVGSYTILANDENGCQFMEVVEVTGPASPLQVSVTPGSILPEQCIGELNGSFTIDITGGKAPYKVSLDDKKGTYVDVTTMPHVFENLKGGLHNVYVIDANGCTFDLESVSVPLPVDLTSTVKVEYGCETNTVTVDVIDTTVNPADLDYALDNESGTYQSENVFKDVLPGDHVIYVRHTNGCSIQTPGFKIDSFDKLTVKVVSAGVTEMNVIEVIGVGGKSPYEYSFNGEPFTSSNKYNIYKSGDYEVIVRDQNGCTATIIVPMIYVDVCIPNYFTPNGDGLYDGWGPGCTNIYNNLEFSIFDRYGRIIAKYHYGEKWDGKYNGEELPTGDYWYVLKLNDEKDAREFVGHFTLYR